MRTHSQIGSKNQPQVGVTAALGVRFANLQSHERVLERMVPVHGFGGLERARGERWRAGKPAQRERVRRTGLSLWRD